MTTREQDRLEPYRIALSTDWYEWMSRVRWCLVMIAFACAFDGFTTIRFMVEYGPSLESHLGIRLVSTWFGPYLGPVIGKLCQIAAFVLFSKLWPNCTWPLAILIVIGYTMAGWHNLSM
ncbi:MAG: hypothetical protein ACPGVU_24060 [Limisphaerales bacterium]